MGGNPGPGPTCLAGEVPGWSERKSKAIVARESALNRVRVLRAVLVAVDWVVGKAARMTWNDKLRAIVTKGAAYVGEPR